MTSETQDRRDYTFLLGLLTGTFVGAGLAIWLVPKAAPEVRKRVTDSARELSDRASESYQQVSDRVDEAVGDLTATGQGVRGDMADAVIRGARKVERIAKAAKTA